MIKKFLNAPLPIYVVVIVLLFAAVGFYISIPYFRSIVYNYNLELPQGVKEAESLNYGEWPVLANAEFYKGVRDKMIAEKTNFIEADLSAMKITLYSEGNKINEFTILSKGKPGSWWETPAGLYKIESKAKNLFSSFGKVYMPWSMQFEGNFFIHGWPYYPNGEPVASTYSGGCIRVSNDDAQKVYDWIKVGTPVLVFENEFEKDNFNYSLNSPQVSAKSYLAADVKNNFVFAEKNSTDILPIASITKLITTLVATDYINLEKKITITKGMLIPTSKPRLYVGQQISAMNLLYPLLLESSNEASVALSQYLGQENFIALMNKKAQALGMINTKFVDSYGGGDNNISSSQDLFNLAKYLYTTKTFILNITSGGLKNTAYGQAVFSDLGNFNLFGEDPSFIGGKIGKTQAANETMLALFQVKINEIERPISVIVLGSDNQIQQDIQTILNWIKINYTGR